MHVHTCMWLYGLCMCANKRTRKAEKAGMREICFCNHICSFKHKSNTHIEERVEEIYNNIALTILVQVYV